ncbi:MAG TPA: hypothetical protein VJ326_03520 [Thermoplasmata archaeon]|nr:hypothetical protein [Thermoplasmata archaeon]
MRVGFIIAGLVMAMSVLAAPSALTQANDIVVEFSRTIEAGSYTVNITGSATISPVERTASGTIHILVTDDLGETVAEVDVLFEAPSGGAESVPVPAAGLVIHFAFDAQHGVVAITIESIGAGRGRAGA